MISYNQSIKILKKSIIEIKDEIIKTDKCLNRVTAENVKNKYRKSLIKKTVKV